MHRKLAEFLDLH
jgi:hypothetical protein